MQIYTLLLKGQCFLDKNYIFIQKLKKKNRYQMIAILEFIDVLYGQRTKVSFRLFLHEASHLGVFVATAYSDDIYTLWQVIDTNLTATDTDVLHQFTVN